MIYNLMDFEVDLDHVIAVGPISDQGLNLWKEFYIFIGGFLWC